MIVASGLTKRFGDRTILADVDLHVAAGERVAILGLNGAGKTTLVRCLLGLTACEGQLYVAGDDPRQHPVDVRRHIGYVPQRAPLFDGSLVEFLEFFAQLRGLTLTRVRDRLDTLGLPTGDHEHKPLTALSGGMLQKLLLALALGSEVPLLLLDEPTANLDARARGDFLQMVRAVDADTTVVLATHRLSDVQAVADRLIVIHDGRIAFDGPKSDLIHGSVGAGTLWLRVPPERREVARTHLAARFPAAVVPNGTALGVRLDGARRVEAVMTLRNAGIAIDDVWTDMPDLRRVLESVISEEVA